MVALPPYFFFNQSGLDCIAEADSPSPSGSKQALSSLRVTDVAVLSEALDPHLKESPPLCTSPLVALRGKDDMVTMVTGVLTWTWSPILPSASLAGASRWAVLPSHKEVKFHCGYLILPSDSTWTDKVQGLSEVAAHLRTSGQKMSGAPEPSSHLIPCPHHSLRHSNGYMDSNGYRVAWSRPSWRCCFALKDPHPEDSGVRPNWDWKAGDVTFCRNQYCDRQLYWPGCLQWTLGRDWGGHVEERSDRQLKYLHGDVRK